MRKLIVLGMILSLLIAVAPVMASEDTASFLALNNVAVQTMSDDQLATVEGQSWYDRGHNDYGRKGNDHNKKDGHKDKHDGKHGYKDGYKGGKDFCSCGPLFVNQVNTAVQVGVAEGAFPSLSQTLSQANIAAITR
jgi:hypothetical protein